MGKEAKPNLLLVTENSPELLRLNTDSERKAWKEVIQANGRVREEKNYLYL